MIHQGIHSIPIKFPIELSVSYSTAAKETDDALLLYGNVVPAMPNGRFCSIGISRERAAAPYSLSSLVEPPCHQIEAFAFKPIEPSCFVWIEYLPLARTQPSIPIYVDAVDENNEGQEQAPRSLSFDDTEEVYTFHFQICKGSRDSCLFECQYLVRFVEPFHLVFLDHSGPELWSVDIRKSSPHIQIVSAQLAEETLELGHGSITMRIYNFELDGQDVKFATNIRLLIQLHSASSPFPSLPLLKWKMLIQSNIRVVWMNALAPHPELQHWTPHYARDMDDGHGMTAASSAVQIDLEALPIMGHLGLPIAMHFVVRSLVPTRPLYLASLDLLFDEQEAHCLVAGLRSRSGAMLDKANAQSAMIPPLSTPEASFSHTVLWPFQPLKIPFVFVPVTIGALELPRIQVSYHMDRNEKFIISSIKKKLWIAPLPLPLLPSAASSLPLLSAAPSVPCLFSLESTKMT